MNSLVWCFLGSDLSVLNPRWPFWTWLLNHTKESSPLYRNHLLYSEGIGGGRMSKNNCKWRLNKGGASSLGTLAMTHNSITEEGHQQRALCICLSCSPDMEKCDMEKDNSLSKPPFPTEKHLPGDVCCSRHFQIRWLTSLNTKTCGLAPLGKREPVNRERLHRDQLKQLVPVHSEPSTVPGRQLPCPPLFFIYF